MNTEYFHGTPPEFYDRLSALFGERHAPGTDTRWVEIGAGPAALMFFPAEATAEPVAADPVVRDPEAWQAVAAEGRRFA